jgi:hypothetical protein
MPGKISEKQISAPYLLNACFLLDLIFDVADKGDMSLRDVG